MSCPTASRGSTHHINSHEEHGPFQASVMKKLNLLFILLLFLNCTFHVLLTNEKFNIVVRLFSTKKLLDNRIEVVGISP